MKLKLVNWIISWLLFIMVKYDNRSLLALNSPVITVNIGGVFTDRDEGSDTKTMEYVFKSAVFYFNRKNNTNWNNNIKYSVETINISATGSAVQAVKDVCSIIETRHVSGMFGPPYPPLSTLVQSMCYYVDIPFVNVCSTCYDSENDDDDDSEQTKLRKMFVNLYPSNRDLNLAFQSLTQKLQWTKFLIIYDTDSGLTRLQGLLNAPGINQTDILVRQLTDPKDRSVLTDAIGRDIFNVILDLNDENTKFVLRMALQLGMINSNYHYLLTTLDIDTYDLEDYKYNYVNITAYRLFNRDSHIIQDAMKYYFEFKRIENNEQNRQTFTTQVALWIDALSAFAMAYDKFLSGSKSSIPIDYVPNPSCHPDYPAKGWPKGNELYSKFQIVKFYGLSGSVQFSSYGERTNFELQIVHLSETGLVQIGTWDLKQGANFTLFPMSRGGLFNSTLIVTTIIEPPYVMLKKNSNSTEVPDNYTNEDFEGFCIDLLEELSIAMKFSYKIEPIRTRSYQEMVDHVKKKEADLAVAPLTINYAREKQIDFTKPFLSLGIAILFKLPLPEKPGLFSFLSPLSLEIWIYTFTAVLTVSLILLLIARCSPDEWRNPYPCDTDYNYLENRFTVSNTLWFSIGTLMQQGSDVSPSAISTRLVSGIWWFFTLILISSYTANLAAFLTVEKLTNPIESAEDLAKQSKYKYGVLKNGTTQQFFKESSIPTYQTMWKQMVSNPDVFVDSNSEGIEKTQKGQYAYLMESTTIEYTVQRECSLTQIGGLLDNKGYGIGLPEGSPHREKFSEIILDLQEKGIIQKSYNKWWKGKGSCVREDKKDSKASPLGVKNVGGIFVVLLGGIILALIVAVGEFIYHARKNHPEHRHSVWYELLKELRFAIQCNASNRKSLVARRCSQCKGTDTYTTEENSRTNSLPSNDISAISSFKRRKKSSNRSSFELEERSKFDTILLSDNDNNEQLSVKPLPYYQNSIPNNISNKTFHRRRSSTSPPPDYQGLVLVEQAPSTKKWQLNESTPSHRYCDNYKQVPSKINVRPQHVRFSSDTQPSPTLSNPMDAFDDLSSSSRSQSPVGHHVSEL